jgi:excisionase family DNA binding protein
LEFDEEADADEDEVVRFRHAGERLNLPDRRLLTVGDVAEATGLSPNAIYRAVWDGELRASKLRGRLRVQPADLDVWIDSNLVTNHKEPPAPARPPGRNGPGRGLRELLEAE